MGEAGDIVPHGRSNRRFTPAFPKHVGPDTVHHFWQRDLFTPHFNGFVNVYHNARGNLSGLNLVTPGTVDPSAIDPTVFTWNDDHDKNNLNQYQHTVDT